MLSFGIAAPVIDKLGVRKSFLIFFSLACLSSILYIALPIKSEVFISIMVFMARLGICPCYSLAFICSNELFPAELKSTLMGFCNIIARGLCMTAPLVANLKDPIPFYVFGSFAFVCGIATQFLTIDNQNKD